MGQYDNFDNTRNIGKAKKRNSKNFELRVTPTHFRLKSRKKI
jgi:hypothetical protein